MPGSSIGLRKAAPNGRRSSAGRKRLKAEPRAWWLTIDLEVCETCEQGYAYGSGYRCAGCDGAVCAVCVVIRRGEFWCPEC
jgi:hypothetical protein